MSIELPTRFADAICRRKLPTRHGAGGMSSGASFDISMDVSISLSTDVPPSGGRPRASVGAGVDRRYRCEPSPRRWSRPLRRIARAAVVLRLPKQFVQLLPNIGAACGARRSLSSEAGAFSASGATRPPEKPDRGKAKRGAPLAARR
ncbi:hypothetical protein [Burkholderia pseudomallei]|uniref:hypothetical protein n=1 Tax=Burkholderia pseudomallei TaxID=28450 RepID=UPI001E39F87D|nr:hypothetical protein [Burkholderia pseudomallei]